MRDSTYKVKSLSVVITSCGRLDLLEQTISSFLKFNTYPVSSFLIIEDSGDPLVLDELNTKYGSFCDIIFNEPKIGHLASVDKVYSLVNTDYVFHCEDDWVFYRSGFIEDILDVLESDHKIKHVGIRSIQHEMLVYHHTLDFETEASVYNGIRCYKALKRFGSDGDLTGFSFNPSVVRMSDYRLIGNYQEYNSENGISEKYHQLGFYSVYLENDAVKHIGWNRSTIIERLQKNRNHRRLLEVRFKNFIKSFLNLLGFDFKLVS